MLAARVVLVLLAVSATACGATNPDDGSAAADGERFAVAAAFDALAGHPDFGKPITLEVWSHAAGPTARQLEARGYLAGTDGGRSRFRLTELGRAAGVRERFFQDDIPVFVVPVATRELVSVDEVSEALGAASVRAVRFTFRSVPTELGAGLLVGGVRLDGLVPGERRGEAILAVSDAGWRVSILSLAS